MSTAHAVEERLAAEPASVRAVRRLLADLFCPRLTQDGRDAVLLAASEVVTNAVEHGAPPIALLARCDGHGVRVEVRDASPLLPRTPTEEPGPMEVRGRGLLIVERCSDRWGVEPNADGKTVWFEVDA